MSDMNGKGIEKLVALLVLCFCVAFITAQVTFSPDPDEDVQLQVLTLSTPVKVTTIQCYSSPPLFQIQYVATADNSVSYDIYIGRMGIPVPGSKCGQSQRLYNIILQHLRFISDPLLIGGTFRLKATLNNNEGRSTLSKRTYTFPAPLNLTGSSISAVANHPYTWTCHVTPGYPVIEWFRGALNLGQIGSPPYANGSCLTYGQNISLNYIYRCQPSNLTYTLTIPGPSITEKLRGSIWRCKDVTSEVKGSKFRKLDIIVPVTTVTVFPGSGSSIDVDENQSVTFTCITNHADPPPTIHWLIGSSDVTSQAGPNRTTLTIDVTGEYDYMRVSCTAWNSGNNAYPIDSTTLYVKSSAMFLTGQYIQGVHLYRTGSIRIPFYCNPPVKASGVEWINKTGLNNKPMDSSETVSFSLVECDFDLVVRNNNITRSGHIAFMNITSVQRYHRGYYMLRIQNSASLVASFGMFLDVLTLPDPPTNLTVQCMGTEAHLSWTSSDMSDTELAFYLLYKEEDEVTFTVLEKENPGLGRSKLHNADISNIKSQIVYHFKAASRNVYGLSEYTDIKTCIILPDKQCSDGSIETSASRISGGVVAGSVSTSGVFLVVMIIMVAIMVIRERRYRTKGDRSKENKSSFAEYKGVQSPNRSNEEGTELDHSQDERSTYEELQNQMTIHTYEQIRNGNSATEL